MDDALGYGDDSLWKGLACPPIEEFAFNFDETCYKLDCILDDPLLEGEIEEEHSITTNVRTHCYGKGKELNLIERVLKVEKPRITSYDCQIMHQAKDRTGLDYTNEVAGTDKRTNKVAKSNHCYGNFGKGKELKLDLNMAEIKAFLEEEIKEVVEIKDKKRKIRHDFDCQSVQRKDMMRLNSINRFAVVDNERKDDFDLRLEAGHKLHESTGQPMQRKDVKRLDHTNRIGVVDNKRKAGSDLRSEVWTYESTCQPMQRKDRTRMDDINRLVVLDNKSKVDADFRLEASRHKLQETYKSACQPMRREDRMRLNELAVAEKKRETDYNSRFEATTHKLHESYERLREAKQKKQIQVIEFKKLVMEQSRCKAKSNGKSSLRQRLIAMGTHKSNKKFHPFLWKTMNSCTKVGHFFSTASFSH